MGATSERPPPTSAVRFAAPGSRLRQEVRLEDGSRLGPGRPLPAGYHRLGDTLEIFLIQVQDGGEHLEGLFEVGGGFFDFLFHDLLAQKPGQ